MVESEARGPLRVIGRYALFGEIAAGGMATVHIGRLLGPVGFSRTIAIKRLHPQYAKDPEFVSMFLDEARVAARIQHPNVVATLDVVALEGELFLVMEYVDGESLARILRTMRSENRTIPPKIAGSIVVNLLNGLHAAHEAKSERGEPLGIVHRDVSPQNVLVGTDGISRVLDFGVAKATGRVQTTKEGQVKGKIAYMPPEQLSGEAVDRRCDVYAASVVLWETLTARRLFDGDNDGVVLTKVLSGKVAPPSSVVPGISSAVDDVIMRGLARNPDKRFQTAAELAVALEDTLGIESPRKITEFLRSCAGEALAKRAARVKQIEMSSGDLSVEPSTTEAVPAARTSSPSGVMPTEHSGTRLSSVSASVAAPPLAPPRSPKVALIAVAGAAGVALLVGLIVLLSGSSKPPDSASSARMSEPSGSSASIGARPPAAPTASASAAPSASASAAPSATPPKPNVPQQNPPSTSWPTPPIRPPNKPDCSNPKVWDPVKQIMVIRPECR
ncbi:MAG: serine/threonine-protein kinase [Polyangiaceae bacterium]